MIVDDHADMRRVLMSLITHYSYESVEFIECQSGEDAIIQYPQNNPDYVLMDIELKSMSGFQVTEEIYKQNAGAKIIIVTSYDTPTFRRKAKDLHTTGFVSKDKLSDLQQFLHNITIN